ncbi:hypothetical protein dsat_0325 [Alkalidesulfovibrio alkalitolerans DSM 16529]|jgi:cell division protein ZapB|uniref:Cell division protein ZapB n=1 Tax=Alkalidesulfovibrio alkalitolerans DSM 16529 TaxID=1121439 RepID=S7UGE2_9BACT|nr:hypothetical protein [Alkalidesulfovibrio alkalitolerans]EPR32884.1 hypothetical protein dsat_0325 [Alkalidesulfovibrio alkalitolerans DSM 16529]
MEILEQLEQRMTALLNRIKELEEENSLLRSELEEARRNRDAVMNRIDGLLRKVQGALD